MSDIVLAVFIGLFVGSVGATGYYHGVWRRENALEKFSQMRDWLMKFPDNNIER